MKTKLLLCILFFFCLKANSQTDTTLKRKFEINVGFTNVFHLFSPNYGYEDDYYYYGNWGFGGYGGYGYGYYYGNYYPTYGIGGKYHLGKHAVRMTINYMNSTINENGHGVINYGDSIIKNINTYNRTIFKIGYQFEKSYKKTSFITGIDFFYDGGNSTYDLRNTANSVFLENGYFKITKTGISPFLGIEWRFNKMFSMTTETTFKIASYKIEGNYTGYNYSTGNYSGSFTGSGKDNRFIPFGLISFNISL